MINELILPHGGELILNLVEEQERQVLAEEAPSWPQLLLEPRQLADLEMLAVGAYSPLKGFIQREDYNSVLRTMHLASGLPWTIPITLPVSAEQIASLKLKEGSSVALVDQEGTLYAELRLEEIFPYDPLEEAYLVYRTTDEAHPGVQTLYRQGRFLLGGPVRVLRLPRQDFGAYRYTPADTRRLFEERGWGRVVGFQTRNPVHRAHEYIQKCALELVDGLLLHPLVGETREEDIPPEIRIRCYEVLIEHYFPTNRVLLGVLPAAMRYAGPREAIFHALIRKNYGCSHFIVGRDHAGVGGYYGSYDAQHIFSEFDARSLAITPLFFEHTFYCQACSGMASRKTCPHEAGQHTTLSGTKVRQLLLQGQLPPPEFTRPEVAAILQNETVYSSERS